MSVALQSLISQIIYFNKNLKKPLSDKETLARVLTPLVEILLVCKHPASLTTNTVIPFQGLFLRKEKHRFAKKPAAHCLMFNDECRIVF